MIVSLENPKSPTDKLLELINEFSDVVEHKINIQKSTEWLYSATNRKLNFNKNNFTIILKNFKQYQ